MTLMEINKNMVTKCPINRPILKASVWTVCLARYLETCFTNIRKVADDYTMYTDFYENSPTISNFIAGLSFQTDESIPFRMQRNVVTISEEFKYTVDQVKRELFYIWKVNSPYEGIPTPVTFFIQEIYQQTNVPYTYLPALLPDYVLEELLSGELGEPAEVISAITGKDFVVLDEDNPVAYFDKYAEMYIPSMDAVAIVPTELTQVLNLSRLNEITLQECYLSIDGVPLHEKIGKKGAYFGNKSCLNLVDCS